MNMLAVSPQSFEDWLAKSLRGDVLEYHRGYLVADRLVLPENDRATAFAIDATGHAALRASDAGRVCLVQRRHGPKDYSYLAIKRGGTNVNRVNS